MLNQKTSIEPLALSINEAVRVSGLSRSEIYRLLASDRIKAVKSGRTTLVVTNTLKEHLASLPPATFRQAKAA